MHVGELARLTGVSPRTLRQYERQGLLPAVPRRGRYRSYGPEHLARARLVQELRGAGLRLRDVASILGAGAEGSDPCPEALRRLDQRARELRESIARLQACLDSLEAWRRRLHPGAGDCPLCEELEILGR